MTSITNKELQSSLRRDNSRTEYLEVTGIKKHNFKTLLRDVQKELETFIGHKTVTIWIKR